MDRDRMGEVLTELGQPGYRVEQAVRAQASGADDWHQVTSFSKDLRATMAERLPLWSVVPTDRQMSRDGTIKWGLALEDGAVVECVLIAHARGRRTLCVSSQVGCALACRFCATGAMGFGRDLTPWEIVDQALLARREAEREGARLTNVVFMGMGEPLQNLDAGLAACDELHRDAPGLGISARQIAISTAGWVPVFIITTDSSISTSVMASWPSSRVRRLKRWPLPLKSSRMSVNTMQNGERRAANRLR